jgi:hypothetical protein
MIFFFLLGGSGGLFLINWVNNGSFFSNDEPIVKIHGGKNQPDITYAQDGFASSIPTCNQGNELKQIKKKDNI